MAPRYDVNFHASDSDGLGSSSAVPPNNEGSMLSKDCQEQDLCILDFLFLAIDVGVLRPLVSADESLAVEDEKLIQLSADS